MTRAEIFSCSEGVADAERRDFLEICEGCRFDEPDQRVPGGQMARIDRRSDLNRRERSFDVCLFPGQSITKPSLHRFGVSYFEG